MNNELDEHAQLDVEISNLRATDEELEELMTLIATEFGNIATPPKITGVSNDANGSRYELTFRVLDRRHYRESTVQDWLYAVPLVGWRLYTTTVRA